ncbi:MAG: Xaa-Pro peptidase family protein [Candidatus Omnitrophica bacterium]|nr:Xaa-Pro peptidase family protein [Candidatus Omnitrophota bacterium]
MTNRLKNFLVQLREEKLDGFIVSSEANISYLSGFKSCDAYLLVTHKDVIYFTDSRYIEEARGRLKGTGITLKKINGFTFKLIADSCLELGLKRVGFEGRVLPYAEYQKIKQYLKRKVELISKHSLVEGLRQIKEPGEIANIKKAIQITSLAFKFIKKILKPGVKELELAAELERIIRYHGASGSAFDVIVASGPHSSFPHHAPTNRKIKADQPVLIDIGAEYKGYKSDLTRVFFLGKINTLGRRIYGIVQEAQEKAFEKIKPGIEIAEIDAASRGYIAKKGYSEFFGHNLGHGIGLEIHESPSISPKNNETLKPGMVFTVEPAIYLPGKFGIRLEDIALITKDNCEVLSGTVNK